MKINVTGESETVKVPMYKVAYYPNGADDVDAELVPVYDDLLEERKDEDNIPY